MRAVENSQVACVLFSIETGAIVTDSWIARQGVTPLHVAAMKGLCLDLSQILDSNSLSPPFQGI
jgi:hypothetical protein